MSKRHPIIAGNWKMHKTLREAQDYAIKLLERLGDVTQVDVVICAPFTLLSTLKDEWKRA